MSRMRVKLAIGVALLGAVVITAAAVAGDRGKAQFRTDLSGYEEVPTISTPGVGSFKAAVNRAGTEIRYKLEYEALPTAVTQAHIHFEQQTNNGNVVAFLCTNLANGPAGTPACPANGGEVRGTIGAAQVTNAAAAQKIAAGEIGELIAAMQAGATYVNVHTAEFAGGEIRGQIDGGHHGDDDDRHHDDD
jgi:CHRD domain-containing protein